MKRVCRSPLTNTQQSLCKSAQQIPSISPRGKEASKSLKGQTTGFPVVWYPIQEIGAGIFH